VKNIAISRTIHHSPECLRTSAYTNSTPFGLMPAGPRLAATGAVLRVCFFPTQSTTGIAAVQQPTSTSTVSLSTASLSTSTTKCDANHERIPLTEREVEALHKSKTTDRSLRSNALFVFLLVLVLSIAVLVLVLEATECSYPAYWSTSSREPPQSTIGIAAVQTAIEYEYDETRCDEQPFF
jgi:hypothetical protein